MKIIALLLVAAGIFYILRELGSSKTSNNGNNGPRQKDDAEAMKPCALCKIHVPETEGITSNGHFFCCDAHRLEYREKDSS